MIKSVSVLSALAVLTAAANAAAATCRTPNVKVINERPETIRVKKIQYFDGCDKKWRTEVVVPGEIPTRGSALWIDNLEYVGNCKIPKFKLYRAIRQQTGPAYGAYQWGGVLVPDEGKSHVCNTGVRFTLHAYA